DLGDAPLAVALEVDPQVAPVARDAGGREGQLVTVAVGQAQELAIAGVNSSALRLQWPQENVVTPAGIAWPTQYPQDADHLAWLSHAVTRRWQVGAQAKLVAVLLALIHGGQQNARSTEELSVEDGAILETKLHGPPRHGSLLYPPRHFR